LLIVNRLWPTH